MGVQLVRLSRVHPTNHVQDVGEDHTLCGQHLVVGRAVPATGPVSCSTCAGIMSKRPPLPLAACEFCGTGAVVLELRTLMPVTNRDRYAVCPNCLPPLVNLSLSPAQYRHAKARGGDMARFYLHADFYDDDGRALQPGGASALFR